MRLLALLSFSVLASCTVGDDYERPATFDVETFRGTTNSDESFADLPWFAVFQDPVLHEIVVTALEKNYDLRIAAERVVAARERVTIANAGAAPQVNATGSYEEAMATRNGTLPPPTRQTQIGSAGVSATWDLDFWGRFARATEAAKADLLATEAAREAVIQSLVTDLAIAYFQLLELDAELDIANRTVASRQVSAELVRLRLEQGVANMVEMRQAENLVLSAQRLIPSLDQSIEQQENLIRLLMGDLPGAVPRGNRGLRSPRDISVPVGLPSQLLERRPDVRRAEMSLVAANARVGEAKALLYPNVSLTGFLGRASQDLDELTHSGSGAWNAGASITAPLFNGNRLRSGVAVSESEQRQAALEYLATLQQAFRDVADALIAHEKSREIRGVQSRVTTTLDDQVKLSRMRYRGGVTSYLEVLDSERDHFEAELQLARTIRDELISTVVLYRALGGGWHSTDGWAASGQQYVAGAEATESSED